MESKFSLVILGIVIGFALAFTIGLYQLSKAQAQLINEQ